MRCIPMAHLNILCFIQFYSNNREIAHTQKNRYTILLCHMCTNRAREMSLGNLTVFFFFFLMVNNTECVAVCICVLTNHHTSVYG